MQSVQDASFIPVLADRNLHWSQTPSNLRWDVWPINCAPNNIHASVFLYFRYSSRKTYSCNFRTLKQGILLVTSCFFLLVLLWKEFNSHSFIVTFHLSCSICSPPVFYPAVDICWIHVNVRCSASIYSIPLTVSLNDEPRVAHWRQLSVVSAFQFHYIWVRHPQRVSWIWHEIIWWWGSCNDGALGHAEHPFIDVAPRFTLDHW